MNRNRTAGRNGKVLERVFAILAIRPPRFGHLQVRFMWDRSVSAMSVFLGMGDSMLRSAWGFPAVLALSVSFALPAGAAPDLGRQPPREAAAPASVQLAQGRSVDIFYDERGNRVILDARTGEVIAVEPPAHARRPDFRELRQLPVPGQMRGDPGAREIIGGPYDLSDPRERARFRRDREILLGLREPPPPGARDRFDDDFEYEEDWPSAGQPRGEQPSFARPAPPSPPSRDGITRTPLPEPGTGRDTALALPDAAEPAPPPASATPRALPEPGAIAPMPGSGATKEVASFQVLLDRVGASPGVIDGRIGDNVNKAIAAYRDLTGQALRTWDPAWIEAELAATGGPAFVDYEITNADAAGPFVASIPEDYGQKARMEHLGYTSVTEALAERFHMDENYLKALNPGVDFNRPGTVVRVANPARRSRDKVERIVADKGAKQVRAYGASGRLVAVYPSTIGSAATPSPSGTHTVERIALDPEYTYNPRINFKQGDNDRVLTIPPGPNGPVGSVWIALSKPTYGIHGTPEPSRIGKNNSNGCIRLTNWDARELARLVRPGVTVEFVE